jgi:ATP-dependent Clp protease ATP-binding subunit ClpB
MTSNIGSEAILDIAGSDARYEEMRKRVMEALRNQFRPEFLNRVDDMVLFHTLSRAELRQIVELQMQRVRGLLAEQKIGLTVTDTALDYIVEVGFDPVYGARPLKRAVQREVENVIATKLLEGLFEEGDTISMGAGQDELVFERLSGSPTASMPSPVFNDPPIQTDAEPNFDPGLIEADAIAEPLDMSVEIAPPYDPQPLKTAMVSDHSENGAENDKSKFPKSLHQKHKDGTPQTPN